jgi:chaperonin GroEL
LKSKNFNYGYDAKLKQYKDLVKGGIIDPVKVTKAALTNASSVSQLLLTMNCAIY